MNVERKKRGLSLLTRNPLLEKSAQAHADDMVKRNYFSHTSLGGSTPEDRIRATGYLTKPCTVRKTGPKSFNITLTEGKKHQIRRMVSALHNTVIELERTRILNIRLDNLKSGAWRTIEGEELTTFLAQIGMR